MRWQADLDERQHIVAVLHCAEAISKTYKEPVVVLSDLRYMRERYLKEVDRPLVVERIDPNLY